MSNNLSLKTLFPAIVALGILTGGLVALTVASNAFNVVLRKRHTPLQAPLRSLPKKLGAWVMPKGAVDQRLSAEVVQVLGTHHYLLRPYVNTNMPAGTPGSQVDVNLNYYPTDFATPHVPNVCWAGVGMKRIHDSLITIRHVPHADGTYSNLEMRFLSFYAPKMSEAGIPLSMDQHRGRYVNVAYVFQVDGRYVPNPEQVSELFWRTTSKYGYDAKIEVTAEGPGGLTTRPQARRAIASFIRAALPAIERLLPNWKKLNAPKSYSRHPEKTGGAGPGEKVGRH
ncbi:MAG: exosortase-associated EpsI family protein [Phycisphaerae bacterium]